MKSTKNKPQTAASLLETLPKAKKRFGQNFLVNQAVIQKIIHAIRPKPQDHMVEIGPGRGAMTKALLPYLTQLSVIELDSEVIPLLSHACQGDEEKLVIYQQDALLFDFTQQPELPAGQKLRVVGNLPYNISTPLLFHLLKAIDRVQDACFMLQKEVVDRIIASPDNKNYGRLSVMLQYYCEVERLFIVYPSAFSPKPKVNSAILQLIPKPTQQRVLTSEQEFVFAQLVKQAFSQRRKTLRNNLKGLLTDWSNVSIDPSRRAESLTVDDFVYLVQNGSFW